MEFSGKNMELSGVNMKFSGNEYGIFRRNNGVFRLEKRANPYKYGVFRSLESLGDIIKWLGYYGVFRRIVCGVPAVNFARTSRRRLYCVNKPSMWRFEPVLHFQIWSFQEKANPDKSTP